MMDGLRKAKGRRKAVAVIEWFHGDEISLAFIDALASLGYDPVQFRAGSELPATQILITYGPYGNFLELGKQVAARRATSRPVWAHWNTEGMPDLRLPWSVMRGLADLRSWIDRLYHTNRETLRRLVHVLPHSWMEHRMLRMRYLGDYFHAYERGWLDVLADSSQIYAGIRSQHGLPTLYVPWGAVPRWYAALGLERDIDVLWMGKRGTRRRSRFLDQLRDELRTRGVSFYVADDVEQPFIFGEERTRVLNRAKITLNLTRTWFDDNFSRFALAAPNRSLIVSEPMLAHCPPYQPGVHYIAAPPDQLADKIVFYLEHEEERKRIVEKAYRLVTSTMPFQCGVRSIMDRVDEIARVAVRRTEEHPDRKQANVGTDAN